MFQLLTFKQLLLFRNLDMPFKIKRRIWKVIQNFNIKARKIINSSFKIEICIPAFQATYVRSDKIAGSLGFALQHHGRRTTNVYCRSPWICWSIKVIRWSSKLQSISVTFSFRLMMGHLIVKTIFCKLWSLQVLLRSENQWFFIISEYALK